MVYLLLDSLESKGMKTHTPHKNILLYKISRLAHTTNALLLKLHVCFSTTLFRKNIAKTGNKPVIDCGGPPLAFIMREYVKYLNITIA